MFSLNPRKFSWTQYILSSSSSSLHYSPVQIPVSIKTFIHDSSFKSKFSLWIFYMFYGTFFILQNVERNVENIFIICRQQYSIYIYKSRITMYVRDELRNYWTDFDQIL